VKEGLEGRSAGRDLVGDRDGMAGGIDRGDEANLGEVGVGLTVWAGEGGLREYLPALPIRLPIVKSGVEAKMGS
jgi:hypothetical protein